MKNIGWLLMMVIIIINSQCGLVHAELWALNIDFSRAEMRWIRENKEEPMRWALPLRSEISFYNNGEYSKVEELKRQVELYTDVKITIEPLSEYEMKDVEKLQTYDCVWTDNEGMDLKGTFYIISDLEKTPYVIYSNKSGNIKAYRDLSGKRVGVISNPIFMGNLQKKFSYIDFEEKVYHSSADMKKALEVGEIDAYIGLLNNFNGGGDISIFKLEAFYANASLAINKNRKYFYSIISKIAEKTRDNDLLREKLREKKAIYYKDLIKFTGKEKKWLQNNQELIVGVDPFYAPLDYIDLYGNHAGYGAEYFKEFEKYLPVKFKIFSNAKDKKNTWSNILEGIESGEIDIISFTHFNNSRAEKMMFSNPILSSRIVAIGNEKSRFIDDLSDLKGFNIAETRGYWINELVEVNVGHFEIEQKENIKEVFYAVNRGASDYALEIMSVLEYYDKAYDLNHLKIVGDIGQVQNYYFAINKEKPELVSIINKLLLIIDYNDIIDQTEIMPIEKQRDNKKIWLLRAIMGLIAILGLIGLYLNRLLKEKNFRIQSEKALAITKEKYKKIVYTIIQSLEEANLMNDEETGEHIKRISKYAYFLAKLYGGLDEKFIRSIEAYASLHDIGKIGVHNNILKKPGKLTNIEFEKMKEHTEIGYKMLEELNFSETAKNIVRYHHERWDGNGYLEGLKGYDIPLEARIISLVDVYDALRMERPYKPSRSHEYVKAIIIEERGRQFEPKLVDLFLTEDKEFEKIYSENTGENKID